MAVTSNQQSWSERVETQRRELRMRQELSWPEHVPRDFPEEISERTFVEIFRTNVKKYTDHPAIEFYGTTITYAQLDQWSDNFAGWLQRKGVQRGDRVGLFLPNCPQFIVLMLGTLKAGAVHVPINPMFKRAELEYEANDAGISVIISPNFLLDIVQTSDLETVKHVVVLEIRELISGDVIMRLPKILKPDDAEELTHSDWTELIAGPALHPIRDDASALAALNYTGGTTGVPKGCMHTQGNMVVAGHNCAFAWGLIGKKAEEREVVLAFTPVFWISGENNGILAPLFSGATVVLLARWDVVTALQAIEEYQVTAMSSVVESYLELLERAEDPARQLGSLRHLRAMSFSRRLSEEIRRQWEKATGGNSVLRESGFGATETHTSNTFTTGFDIDDFDLHSEPIFVGLPMPGTDFLVIDPKTHEPLPIGDSGEIALRSPSNFNGYWQADEKTKESLRDGWVLTGDIGKISPEGALHYLGRQKEMLKVNGMSVFPSEVEVLMARHSEVETVAVVGHPDDKKGQSVHAFVQLRSEADVTAEELEQWGREHMATYKVPTIHLMQKLPKTATGKIRKADLPQPDSISSSR